ncbi:hypothetical protein E5206_04075 [Arthrobacter sp. PAMC25564]|uniref:hypothetical protein n=1 Tax=Arthrobacter sp. PAMC25564 TaxID=2565366 RepID=UPI0010A25AD3|nr:hypothetical protein [Arthrobacter sp. PAMC25564]QCB96206.1 hypothetical protein E5206_04075 [Arthrobacter sp. PAMC25564]
MGALTVLVAPRGLAAGIRDSLTDLSGLDLIGPFVWIEPRMVTGTSIGGVLVADGAQTGITLQGMAGEEGYSAIRLCVLVPGMASQDQVDVRTGQDIAEFLESSMGGRQVLRVRMVITRAGESKQIEGLAQDGWHNLVLAPEESAGPGIGQKLLYSTQDPHDFGVLAASACASVLGLWHGSQGTPLDGQSPLPGQSACLVRAYHRQLDTSAVEEMLKKEVISTRQGLPLPTHHGGSTTYIEDHGRAAQAMSDSLWAKHQGVLRGPREARRAETPKPIGALEALRMMFSFLLAALKGAPRSWANRIATRAKSQAAAAVHGAVFGSAPSQYTVMVDGVTPHGLPVSWLDVRDAAVTLDKALGTSGMQDDHEAAADLSAVWRDYAAGAMTLADAGERVDALPPVQVGTQRAVLRGPEMAVPGSEARFEQIPPHLAAAIELHSVRPFDVLGTFTMEQRLQRAADDPALGLSASRTVQELRGWKAQFEDTFAARVGTRIGQSLMEVQNEVQRLLTQIRDAASADGMMGSVMAKQKRLSWWMKILVGILIAGVAVIAVLFLTGVLTVAAAAIAATTLVLGWFAAALVTFLRGQRDLFRLLNARKQLISDDEVSRRNLRHALRDLRRLGGAYSQFLAWSDIIGTVLNEPFGRAGATGTGRTPAVEGLPLNVRVGAAAVDQQVIGLAAAELRRDLFSVGWLTRSWELAILNAGRQLGVRGYELTGQPDSIFRQPGDGELSLLPDWIRILDGRGIDPAAGEELWAGALNSLEGHRASTAAGLQSTVDEVRGSSQVQTSLSEFMSGMQDSGAGAVSQLFDSAVLTDVGRSAGRAAVDRSSRFQSNSGLSQQLTLVQFSAGIPEHEFLISKTTIDKDWWSIPAEDPFDPTDPPEFVMPTGPTF